MSVSCHFLLISSIFSCFSFNFACFSAIYLQFVPIGRTVWQSSFEQKLGRTELENLAPPDMKKFWQERIEFWQDRIVGPHLKMAQLRLCSYQYFSLITITLNLHHKFEWLWHTLLIFFITCNIYYYILLPTLYPKAVCNNSHYKRTHYIKGCILTHVELCFLFTQGFLF